MTLQAGNGNCEARAKIRARRLETMASDVARLFERSIDEELLGYDSVLPAMPEVSLILTNPNWTLYKKSQPGKTLKI